MPILIGFLYVVEVLVCILLAMVVMLQKPKEGGLGGAFCLLLLGYLGRNMGNSIHIIVDVVYLIIGGDGLHKDIKFLFRQRLLRLDVLHTLCSQ